MEDDQLGGGMEKNAWEVGWREISGRLDERECL